MLACLLARRLPQREPFRTLELGLPCLRPEPPAYLALMQGLRADISSLEALINEIEHKSHLQVVRLARPALSYYYYLTGPAS